MKNKLILLAKADFAEYKQWYIITFLMVFLLPFSHYTYTYIEYVGSDNIVHKINLQASTNGESVDLNTPEMIQKIKNGFVNEAYKMALFGILFFSFLILTASFGSYHLKKKGIFTAMLPASKSTKFIYIFLKNWIVFPAILSGLLWLSTNIWVQLWGYSYSEIISIQPIITSNDERLSLLVIGTICFLSAILFKRFQFIFALITVLVMWMILVFAIHFHFIGSTTENIVICGMILVAILATWFKFKYLQIKS